MANVIRKATNKFTKGLVMDFSPENTKNEVLTHALNATLLTFNGNELSLLNDMGNGRVETAFLPEGYIPVGVCEYGGIIYIVSYNPLEDKSLIGCFPSPERNISQDELGVTFDTSFSWEDFLEYKYIESDTGLYVKDGQNYKIPTSYTDGIKRYERVPNGDLTQVSQKVLLRNSNLNPGDKFIVYANPLLLDEKLQDLKVNSNPLQHPIIALNVVSIEDSGKIVYLNNDVRKYTVGTTEYHILGKNNKDAFGKNIDIDSYRNVLSSGYSVFKEKTSGKLAILAELVMIDSYSVTHKIDPITDLYGNGIDGRFKVMISTDVSPYLTSANYYTAPKLRYYYLKESLGKITGNLSETDEVEMFYNGEFNSSFSNLPISSLIDSNETLEGTLGNAGEFNFPKPDTYHGRLENFDQSKHNLNEAYALLSPTKFYRIDKNQVLIEDAQNALKYNEAYFGIELGAIIYEYVPEGTREKFEITDTFNISYIYEIESSKDEYINVCRDKLYETGETLYVQEPNILYATKEIIDNPNVEKFYQQTLDIYKKILDIDNIPEGTVIWINTESGYATYQGSLDPSRNYYTKEVVYKMVSGGYTLEDTSGDWFYYASSSFYREAESLEIKDYFDFNTYPKKDEDPYYGCKFILYRKLLVVITTETVKEEEVIKSLLEGKNVYYITTYRRVTHPEDYTGVHLLFMTVSKEVLTSPDKFLPDPTKNYILGYNKPDTTEFPKDDLMVLKAFAEFIPKPEPLEEGVTDVNALKYTDVKLAEIKIPQSFIDSNLDLPFKYSYTLEPCMNYGKLEHLLVSNTIDFSNLRNFDKSDFTTWKYRIDGNQLMLTFGADVYDTFETDKVSGLFLEFYDWRGFAGSLEISGKRSYSGKFTKILHLDTIGALSNKKVKMLSETSGEFIESYNHNANILEQPKTNPDDPSSYTLNGDTVVHDSEFGWRKVKTDDLGNTVYQTLDEDNDCGVLYSNLIYGVKPYLIVQRETDIKIIKKPDLFLFTMPVYNDYYYSVDSFRRLMNPKVNLVLTYRLTDDSEIYPYLLDKSDDYAKIDNGYLVDTETYQNDILTYLKGMSTLDSLNVKRYFRYTGKTKLQLEIGLLLDYELYNLSCDPLINEKFTCKLELLTDSGESNTVLAKTKDNIEDPCNWDNNVDSTNHYFGFNPAGTYFDTNDYLLNFSNYNFLEGRGSNAIELDYQYIVGFDSVINDIRKDTVQATAVCALYHQNDGVYNTNDFGIREETYTEENDDTEETTNYTLFLPEAMVYNSGSETEQLFGLCRMVNPKGGTMTDQCVSYSQYSGMVKYIDIPGKLNAGDPLRNIVNSIGKLTFCQPHAHGLFASNSTSIDSSSGNYADRYITKKWINLDIVKRPVYNMSVNTLNMMNSASEFISVTKNGTFSADEVYTSFYGLTAPEIAKFNRCMLETMKNVYVYNPDYDNFPVKRGDVIVDDTLLLFTSNIITHSAKFTDGTDFNHFLKIGTICVDKYLEQLNRHSNISVKTKNDDGSDGDWVNGIKFEPDFTYCGVDSDNKYLVSSLTYNIPVPQELYDDLQLDFSDSVIVRHSDESCDFIQGAINKKSLYGWFTRENVHKLVELDITNYNINLRTGELSVLDNGGKYETIEDDLTITLTEAEMDALLKGGTKKIQIERTMQNGLPIKLNVEVAMPGGAGFEYLGYETSLYHRDEEDKRHWAYFWSFINGYPNPVNINNKYYMLLEVSMDTPYHSVYTKNATMQIEMSHFGFNDGSMINFYYPDYDKTLYIDEVGTDDIQRIILNKLYWTYLTMGVGGWYWSSSPLQLHYGDLFDDYFTDLTVYITDGSVQGKQLMVWGNPTYNWNGSPTRTNTGFNLYYDPGFGELDGMNIAILRFRILDFTVKIQKYKGLAEFESDILQVKKTAYYSQFDSNGNYDIKYTLTGTNQTLVGSSLVLNDLLYYPEIDGHRLFVRDSMFRSNSSRFPILYRNNGSSNLDLTLNALRTYTGPCYNQLITINDTDPESKLS